MIEEKMQSHGHICCRCGWSYANPHPSAKQRRAHKKVCGNLQGFKILKPQDEKDPLFEGSGLFGRQVSNKSEEEEFSDAVSDFSEADLRRSNSFGIQLSDTPNDDDNSSRTPEALKNVVSQLEGEAQFKYQYTRSTVDSVVGLVSDKEVKSSTFHVQEANGCASAVFIKNEGPEDVHIAKVEAFEAKQANMFMALDKLFTLHNSILRESRTLKSFCFYFFTIIILYMLTSTKQTYCVRVRLYLGLCGTFLAEFAILRLCDDLDQQTLIASKILLARVSFLALASFQILFSIFTYRDYEVLNHRMLQALMEKVNIIEKQKLNEEITESDISLSSWIDTELPEDEENDPDYLIKEEIAENSTSTTSSMRKYNLRPRFQR